MLTLKDDGGTFRDRLSLAEAKEASRRKALGLGPLTLRLAEPRAVRRLQSIHVDLTQSGGLKR